jgi:HAE1 family hydrophobic/amphiphilic exporter-1
MQQGPPRRHFTTHRPVAVLMVFTAAVVFGFFSLRRLPITLMPELSYPTLTVRTEYPGTAPEEVENEVSRPIEEALGVVSKLNKISSVSRAGLSDVVLEFLWGTDMSKASQEVLEKLDLVFLPREAERPLILHFDPALDPIMELSLAGAGERFAHEQGLRRLRRIADLQVKRALERIKGVAAVRVRGGLEEEYHVLVDKLQLARAGLSIQTVIDRLKQENINVAGGTLKEGRAEYMVRTLNEFVTLDEIANTVVARFDRGEVRVRDLARVIRAHKDREIVTRTDGAESVQIDIYKEADANIVAVARAVTTAVGRLAPPSLQTNAPAAARGPPGARDQTLAGRLMRDEGARLTVVADRSLFIESSIREVWSTALLGGLLAIVVLFLFLGDLKTTAIIGISIPMSLLITFAPLNLAGISLNIMSLGGLALGVGMLVDCSIVVLESIFRCREEGDDLIQAAIRGTNEVKAAVVASTLTTVAVFLPMVFVEGIAGQAFGDLGLAVVTSLLASLAVAVYFVPMLASRRGLDFTVAGPAVSSWTRWQCWEAFSDQRQHRPPRVRHLAWIYLVLRLGVAAVVELVGKLLLGLVHVLAWAYAVGLLPAARACGTHLARPLVRRAQDALGGLRRGYPSLIGWSLTQPVLILSATALCGWLTWHAGSRLETELLPEVHQGEFTFEVNLAVGTPIEHTTALLEGIEQAILANKADIERLIVTFGYDVTNMKRSDEGEHSARFKILTTRQGDPVATEERVLERLRPLFASVPDAEMRVVRPVLFSAKAPIVVEIEGDDLAKLKTLSQRAESVLSDLPELADVEASLRSGAPEIQVIYHRDRLATYGLNIATVARQVRDMVKGFEASRFNQKDRRIPIVVRLEESDRRNVEDVGRLMVNPGGEQPIPLSAVADLRLGEGPSEIRRVDGQRVAQIEANLGLGSLGAAAARIQSELRAQLDWPADTDFKITGQNEEWERSRGSLYLALGLSLFLVYVIMAAQFESLIQPLLIMVSVPLAFFGSALGLAGAGINLSIVVFLGLITLAGIVVNNAIVLVDYANTLRARGLPLAEAIATAGAVRLRPILMTTATTVLGLLPMALGWGDGAEIRTPMALTVVFGLLSSTVLTLVVIPTLYYLTERLRERLRRPNPELATPAPIPPHAAA